MKQSFTLLLSIVFMLGFQLAFGQWVSAPGILTATFTNTAVAWDNKVYFTGGAQTASVTTTIYNRKVEMLDLETGTVTNVGELSVGRCAIGGVAYNGKIYFAGGHRWVATAPGLQLSDDLEIFDVESQTWEYKKIPTAKTWFGMAVVKGKIMLAGGHVKVGNQILQTDVVDVYDPELDSWSVMHLSEPRGELAAGVIGNKVWFCGGQRSWTIWDASSRVDAYDADLDKWTQAELSSARSYTAVATAGKYMICAGGYTNTEGSSAQVDILNTEDSIWQTATLSAPRFGIAAATLGSKAYFTGGGHVDLSISYYDQSTDTVDVFDADLNDWDTINMNLNRMAHACAAWGNKIAVGGGWRAEQSVTSGHVEILTDSTIIFSAVDDHFSKLDIAIFPNPTSGEITIQFPDNLSLPEASKMTLFDLTGRACFEAEIRGNSERYDIGTLPPGMYLVEVRSGQGRYLEKLAVGR